VQIGYGRWHADRRRHRQREPASAFARERSGSRQPGRDADALARLCAALDVKIVPVTRRPRDNETTAVATLRGILAAHGEEHFTLTVRTIIETEGNARAMVAPVLLAISDVTGYLAEGLPFNSTRTTSKALSPVFSGR
jgi:hypothetical protein